MTGVAAGAARFIATLVLLTAVAIGGLYLQGVTW